jgi:hypothetical protein
MNAREQKRRFIEAETALTQEEAAIILGCRARDVQQDIQPSFYRNGRPKYRQADVIKRRDQLRRATERVQA